MNEQEQKKSAAGGDLSGTIAAFEQLLEVIPDDPLALESLFEAYREAGDRAQALKYLDRLVGLILQGGSNDVGLHLRDLLQHLAPTFPEVVSRVTQLDKVLSGAERKETRPEAAPSAHTPRQNADLQAELALAWRLFQAGELAQEEYSNVVQDLTEVSARKTNVPVSVLHALQDRSSKNLEKIMCFMSKTSGKPIVALANFEIAKEVRTMLPLDFISHWGAIVFEVLGEDLLVAVLNPFDRVLQNEVASLTNRTCHFYLVGAADYDKALESIRQALAPAAGPAKAS